jgi:hypothetical protein
LEVLEIIIPGTYDTFNVEDIPVGHPAHVGSK